MALGLGLALMVAWLIDPFVSVNLLQVAIGFIAIVVAIILLMFAFYPEKTTRHIHDNINHNINEGVIEGPEEVTPKSKLKTAVEA